MDQEEYLSEVARVVRTDFHSNDPTGAMTAARAGVLAHRATGTTPRAFQFFKFRDVLELLAQRGVIELTTTSKGALGFKLKETTPEEGGAAREAPIRQIASLLMPGLRLPRLRNQVWLALVAEAPTGRRFLNRRSGQVRMGLEAEPDPADEWAEIKPIDTEAEKKEAQRFLEAQGVADDPAMKRALDSAQWFRELPVALSTRDRRLAASWNRSRTQRAVARAQDFCKTERIPPRLIFEEPRYKSAGARPPAKRPLKQILLSALGSMSTTELLELEIPAKYLVEVLRPDLLDE